MASIGFKLSRFSFEIRGNGISTLVRAAKDKNVQTGLPQGSKQCFTNMLTTQSTKALNLIPGFRVGEAVTGMAVSTYA